MTSEGVELLFKLRCSVRHAEAEEMYVSYCPALDLFSQGLTEDEAERALESAVGTYLMACFKRGVLEQVLNRLGLRPVKSPVVSEDQEFIALRRPRSFDIEVPLYLVAQAERDRSGCPIS